MLAFQYLPISQKTHGGQLIGLTFVDGGLERKIEVVQSLLNGENGYLNLLLIGPSPFGFCFFRKDVIQDLHDVEIFCYHSFQ